MGVVLTVHFVAYIMFIGASMGWFVGMALLPLLYKHSVYLSEHNWLPYIVLSAFAIAGGILILCIQKVCLLYFVTFKHSQQQ